MLHKVFEPGRSTRIAAFVFAAALLAGGVVAVSRAQTPQAGAPPAAARSGGGMSDAKPRLDTVKLPAGFNIAVYTTGVQGARSMALAPDGTLFAGTRGNKVYAITDTNKDLVGDKVIELATGLRTPNGLAVKDGALYVGELNRIVRFDNVLDAVKAGSASGLTPKVVLEGLPSETMHGWKYIAFGPDGYLYYQIGAPCNVCDRGDPSRLDLARETRRHRQRGLRPRGAQLGRVGMAVRTRASSGSPTTDATCSATSSRTTN